MLSKIFGRRNQRAECGRATASTPQQRIAEAANIPDCALCAPGFAQLGTTHHSRPLRAAGTPNLSSRGRTMSQHYRHLQQQQQITSQQVQREAALRAREETDLRRALAASAKEAQRQQILEERQALQLAEQNAIWESLRQERLAAAAAASAVELPLEAFEHHELSSNRNGGFDNSSSSNAPYRESKLLNHWVYGTAPTPSTVAATPSTTTSTASGLRIIHHETEDQRMLRLTLEQERQRVKGLEDRLKWMEAALKRKEGEQEMQQQQLHYQPRQQHSLVPRDESQFLTSPD